MEAVFNRGISHWLSVSARSISFAYSEYFQDDLLTGPCFNFDSIIGSRAQSRFTDFRVAISFAQEYASQAVSLQDRPYLPAASIIFSGSGKEMPTDLKAVFRKWVEYDNYGGSGGSSGMKHPTSPIQHLHAGSNRSVVRIPLEVAVEAIASMER